MLAYLSDVEHLFDEGVLLKDLTKRLSFSGIEVGFLVEVTLPETVQPVVRVFPVGGVEMGWCGSGQSFLKRRTCSREFW